MKFRKLILLFLLLSLFVVGCSQPVEEKQEMTPVEDKEVPVEPKQPLVEEVTEEVIEEKPIVEEVKEIVDLTCKSNSDCAQGEQCIDGSCGTIAELYETDCESKCNFKEVKIKTTDGDEFTLSRGQGSYTAAGALEWKLLSGPDYCPGDDIVVPIKLIKKSTGKVLSEEVITVKVGEQSSLVNHPTIKKVSFKLTVESVNEECS